MTTQQVAVLESSLEVVTKAEIDMQVATAKAYPRSITTFIEKAKSMATMNQDIAESCTYSLGRGGKEINGPSVRLAEIICHAFGNIRSGARIIANDGKTITAQGICHDLETNNYVSVEVKRSILQNEWKNNEKTGKMVPMSEDMQIVTGNAACAIAYRNAVYKVIPASLVDEVWSAAKLVAKGTADTLPARRDAAIAFFNSIKVTNQQICDSLGIKKVEDIDLTLLSVLSGMRAAIKNQEATVESLFFSKKSLDQIKADLKKSGKGKNVQMP